MINRYKTISLATPMAVPRGIVCTFVIKDLAWGTELNGPNENNRLAFMAVNLFSYGLGLVPLVSSGRLKQTQNK